MLFAFIGPHCLFVVNDYYFQEFISSSNFLFHLEDCKCDVTMKPDIKLEVISLICSKEMTNFLTFQILT